VSKVKERIVLHACCGPCSLEPVRVLREEGLEPVIYFANSNIHPEPEYTHRLETLRDWAHTEGVEVEEGTYDAQAWEETAGKIGNAHAPREARCRACYRLRFEEAARYAHENGYPTLGTTLSVSPYQYTDIIKEELERAAALYGLQAHFEDYRPFYDEATRRSREAKMYRQNYCGCRFSEREAEEERLERKAERAAARAAHAAAHAEERARDEAARKQNRAEKQAYAEKQARKRAALKAFKQQQKQQAEE
jgi:hypothetical protein